MKIMEKSALILAGGSSTRFGQDKGLLPLAGKSLVQHVLHRVRSVVDEELVVTSSETQAQNYRKSLSNNVTIVVDRQEEQSPLVGALTGLEQAKGEYAVILPCDVPFVSKDVISLLFDLSTGRNACIPRWVNGFIEPLQAVYRKTAALDAAREALKAGGHDMQSMIERLKGTRYISTLVLQQLDPELLTFFNVNTQLDLRKAENMIKKASKHS